MQSGYRTKNFGDYIDVLNELKILYGIDNA